MPAHERGMRMLAAEQAAMGAGIACSMVLRPAGLYGPERHPGRFGGQDPGGGGQAVNLVHPMMWWPPASCCWNRARMEMPTT